MPLSSASPFLSLWLRFDACLCPLASTESHGLTVLLQLGDQLVTLAHDVLILLVLVIRPVRLDDALARHPVNGARNAASGDELGEIPGRVSVMRILFL